MLEAIQAYLNSWTYDWFAQAVGRTVLFLGAWALAAKVCSKATDMTISLLGKIFRETTWSIGYAQYRRHRYLTHVIDVVEASSSSRTKGWYARAGRAILGLRQPGEGDFRRR